MAIDWSKIEPKEFEKLCYRILEKENFYNLEWYGASGQDRGRDIVGFRDETPIPGHQVQKKWLIQCKRFLTPLSKSHLYEELVKAVEHQPSGVLFMVSTNLGANLTDWLKSANKQFNFEYVFVWDAIHLESLLSKHKDIQYEFFGTKDKAAEEILEMITNGENKHVEFKGSPVSSRTIVREICAFANSNGGKILIGVSDEGEIVGFKDSELKDKVLNWCNDLCQPPIRNIKIRKYTVTGNPLTVIEVPEGDDKPYFGNNQVFLRHGASVRNASREEIGKFFSRRGFFQYSPELDFSINLEAYRKRFSHFRSLLESHKGKLYDLINNMEPIIETLLSAINGFTVMSRVRSASGEFDFIVINKATNPFLARLDLYIMVEWKIYRKLLSTKVIHAIAARASMLGTKTVLLFHTSGVSQSASLLIKEWHTRRPDRVDILLIGLDDLASVANGENFISILESKHSALTLGF